MSVITIVTTTIITTRITKDHITSLISMKLISNRAHGSYLSTKYSQKYKKVMRPIRKEKSHHTISKLKTILNPILLYQTNS